MWGRFKLFGWIIFSILGIFLLHILIAYLSPFPFNQINVTILFLIWEYVYRAKTNTLWIACGLALLIELFSGLPFGFTTLAILTTLVTTRTFFSIIFTDFSWVTIFLLGVFATLIIDCYLYLFTSSLHIFNGDTLPLFTNLFDAVIKLFVNGSVLLIVYTILKFFKSPKTRQTHF
jgi:hypothetical protein